VKFFRFSFAHFFFFSPRSAFPPPNARGSDKVISLNSFPCFFSPTVIGLLFSPPPPVRIDFPMPHPSGGSPSIVAQSGQAPSSWSRQSASPFLRVRVGPHGDSFLCRRGSSYKATPLLAVAKLIKFDPFFFFCHPQLLSSPYEGLFPLIAGKKPTPNLIFVSITLLPFLEQIFLHCHP